MHFKIRVTDRDSYNIGSEKSDVEIENPSAASEIGQWCDLIVATGTIFINNTFEEIVSCGKPVILYGTTAAGPAHVLGIQRYCPWSV